MIDLFLVYSFIRRLVTPFEKWDAYKEGVIDKNGNILVDKKDRTKEQEKTLKAYDRLIMNIKKMLAKVPGGSTKLASYAAALYLIKEHNMFTEENFLVEETLNIDEISKDLEETVLQYFYEEPTNSAGSGAIAGIGVGPDGEPGLDKSAARKHRKRNQQMMKDLMIELQKKRFK